MTQYSYYVPRTLALALTLLTAILTSAQGANVNLAWNPNTEPNIAGYRVHYGLLPLVYTNEIDVGNSTTVSVPDLVGGLLYFFSVTAYNTLGMESGFASEVAFAPLGQSPTPAPTPGPTPTGVNITGTAQYCTNTVADPVPNVTITRTGTSSGSTVTSTAGNYGFSWLIPGGNYTVTPSKAALTPGSSGVTTYDVVAVLRHYLGITPIPVGCGRTAANVNGDGSVNTADAIAIQKFFVGGTTGIANVGKYQFTPASRTYSAISGNQPGQDYSVLVFGDIISPFVERPEGSPPSGPSEGRGNTGVQQISLPEVAVDQSVTDFVVPVTASTIDANDRLIAFQGDFSFDERVVAFQSEPVQNADLTGNEWSVVANVLPGEGPIRTIRISAYSNYFTPLAGAGTLFNLNMTRVENSPGTTTALTWAESSEAFVFIDVDLNPEVPVLAAPGSITIEEVTPSPGNEP